MQRIKAFWEYSMKCSLEQIANRIKEANQAAAILGVKERLNLNMGDRQLYPTPENISKIVSVIRKYKPEVIFIPAVPDRHPDHGHCASLVEEAVFSAGIKNYEDEKKQEAHKPKYVFYYMINSFHQPDFCVDVTDYFIREVFNNVFIAFKTP